MSDVVLAGIDDRVVCLDMRLQADRGEDRAGSLRGSCGQEHRDRQQQEEQFERRLHHNCSMTVERWAGALRVRPRRAVLPDGAVLAAAGAVVVMCVTLNAARCAAVAKLVMCTESTCDRACLDRTPGWWPYDR